MRLLYMAEMAVLIERLAKGEIIPTVQTTKIELEPEKYTINAIDCAETKRARKIRLRAQRP